MSALSKGVPEAAASAQQQQQTERLSEPESREHKTFHKASRWRPSRAATGRGAGRARCGLHEHGNEQKGSTNKNRFQQT